MVEKRFHRRAIRALSGMWSFNKGNTEYENNNNITAQKWGYMSTKESQKGTKAQASGKTTIRERLQKAIGRLVLFSIIPLVILTVLLNLSSTMRNLENDMLVIAKISADRISEELSVTTTIVSELGCSYQLSSPTFTHRSSSLSTSVWNHTEWSGEN